MSLVRTGTYEFKSLNNLMDFVKPLILEGYPVAIDTVQGKFPREYTIEKFIVYVGDKGVKLSVYYNEPTVAPNKSEESEG